MALFHAMGSPCELLTDPVSSNDLEQIANAAADEAWRIEEKFSRYLSGNIIDRINRSHEESVAVDDETAHLIDFADSLYALSDGMFDITSGALRKVWTFDGGDTLPNDADVAEILQYVGWNRVRWSKPHLAMAAGAEIDLGGIGKEYAVDRTIMLLGESTQVACLVNFGGDLAVTGARKNDQPWTVGIEQDRNLPETKIQLRHGAIATSGDERRFLMKDGRRYSHVLNPKTGWPVEDAPHSVTVAADTCLQAGMISTLAMLQGSEAELFLDEQQEKSWIRR